MESMESMDTFEELPEVNKYSCEISHPLPVVDESYIEVNQLPSSQCQRILSRIGISG